MQHIANVIRERNIELVTKDPVVLGGFTQVPNFILENPDLSEGAKVVYSLFLRYAWDNDFCFPGQQTLAKSMGRGVATVNRFVKELEKVGLIDITKRGQGRTNLYKIKFTVTKKRRK